MTLFVLWFTSSICCVLAFVTLLSSLGFMVATFTDLMQKLCPEQPFATLDRRFYGPLSLALGLAFAMLWNRS